ncbi:hypothetical protein CSC12_2549 [Klebsiella michiganensis]|nr:hypothetical protein CSC12_2549 [Klebsiella michiganensis]
MRFRANEITKWNELLLKRITTWESKYQKVLNTRFFHHLRAIEIV